MSEKKEEQRNKTGSDNTKKLFLWGELFFSFFFGFYIGKAIWWASPFVTGKEEAWDAMEYYLPCLFVAGALSGLIFPKKYGMAIVGIYFGQFGYAFYNLPNGPLWIIGLITGIGFCFIALVTAVVTSSIRCEIAKWINRERVEQNCTE